MPRTKVSSVLPYDPQCRCPVCGCLFSEGDWQLAYVGAMVSFTTEDGVVHKAEDGKHVVVHDDCFVAVWQTQRVEGERPRGLLLMPEPGCGV